MGKNSIGSEDIKIGDTVINIESGVIGVVIKQYYPTSCAQQTMVRTNDGRRYHAPTTTWRLYEDNIAMPCTTDTGMTAAAPVLVKHDYRDIKIDANTTITIDLEDVKKQLARELYKDFDLYRGLKYGG